MKVSDGFNNELIERLNRLRLKYTKQVSGLSGGLRRSNEKGSSNEFSDFRSYSDGDSLRYIDWNSYARLNRLFVKLYMEEKQTELNVLADCSASMGFEDKRYVSGLLAVSLCYAALVGGDRARLTMGKDSAVLASKAGLGTLLDFADSAEYTGSFDIASAAREMRLNQKGRLIVISDFMYPVEELEEAVGYFVYKKQQLSLVMLTSREENEPGFDGELTLNDSETGEKINVEMTDNVFEAYTSALKEHKSKIFSLCRRFGADFTDIVSDADFTSILGRVLS